MRSSVEEGATANFTSNEIIVHGSYRPPTTCYTIFISEFDTIGDVVQITISQRKEDGVEGVCEGTYIFYRLIVDGATLPSSIQITHSNTGATFNLTEGNSGTFSPIPPITTTAE
jgi:predicted RNA-binding protein with TRAM domain